MVTLQTSKMENGYRIMKIYSILRTQCDSERRPECIARPRVRSAQNGGNSVSLKRRFMISVHDRIRNALLFRNLRNRRILPLFCTFLSNFSSVDALRHFSLIQCVFSSIQREIPSRSNRLFSQIAP